MTEPTCNSLGIILPEDILAPMEEAMNFADSIIRQDCDVLRELAK